MTAALTLFRNPWGKIRKGLWEGAWSDGSKEWTTEVKEELGHHFGNDSVFWINYDDFLSKYQHIDRTRLFTDPAWRCTQRWIGVEVPWKPQFHEKFQIKLSKDGPLVLVLSQLDTRYFKGLQGQYTFRIHFRIHERSRPGAEDYIVRSHGNYLMERSVSIELPDMPAGEYSIFMSVAAERDNNLPSVESVVKRECRKRVENDKFAQVGAAYDLAHSKGTAHLEEVARLRKLKEQQRASDSRKTERRKLWERRHLNREITKKQNRKNTEKRDRRVAKAQAAAAAAAEAQQKAEANARAEAQAAENAAKRAAEEAAKEAAEEAAKKAAEEAKQKEEAERPKDQGVQTETAKEDGSSQTVVASETAEKSSTEAGSEKTDVDRTSKSSEDGPKDESQVDSKVEPNKQETPDEAKDDKDKAKDNKDEAKEESTEKPKDDAKEDSNGESKTESTGKEESTEKPKESEADSDSSASQDEADETPASQPSPSPPPPPKAYDSEGDSSDSPVEDWEELYSSDDMVRKPRLTPAGPPKTRDERYESEEEGLPDPWNAICIVGVRVYSMDEDLELRVVMEGGEMLEGGMGKKGEADLDNAQANAGGEREKQDSEDKEDKSEEVITNVKQQGDNAPQDKSDKPDADKKDGAEEASKDSNEDSKSEKSAGSSEYDKLDSGASTPEVIATPEPTPLDLNKELC